MSKTAEVQSEVEERRKVAVRKALGKDLVKLIEQPPCRCCGGKLMLTTVEMDCGGMFRGGDVLVNVYVACQHCHGEWKLCLKYDSVVTVPGGGTGGRGDKSL